MLGNLQVRFAREAVGKVPIRATRWPPTLQENNPKTYLKPSQRYDKTKQPAGDPDCRLGCKRRHNQRASSKEPPPTPPDNPLPVNTISVGEYYWGYASGVVAAIPFSDRGGYKRTFDAQGLPLCQADLPMPLKYTFQAKSSLFEHERGCYVCPLLFPTPTGQVCPIDHKRWSKGGCTTTMATSIGARLRYQLDRGSEAYKQLYNQRTASERINSQAVELGIERPKIRNGQAIANINILIYILINLRTLQRIHQHKADLRNQGKLSASAA